ncbi:LytR/AlgR family response regulator transcription factor [Citricoccus muralis]|uniref:LytTR family DNA-binding domain-containing protein n=1 Tax=Citricoccus muralis TaxID=169134 RepID=A0ABY8H8I9_9MICC|nr:LytTR family DNA-binding domain-containing protein [Citricoccus muralis]WFP16978.1 LytTR family DNA-binding domain-containing protein [Citricoccus muralis]
MTPHRHAPSTLEILVVDDEAPAVAILEWMLRDEPCAGTVHTAASATAALRVLADHPVDVVLLDIHMPGPSGLELARQLRSGASDPPQIIFVTADAQPAVEAFELEARDYLLKPVRAERLHAALLKVAADRYGGANGAGSEVDGTGEEDTRVAVLQGDSTLLIHIAEIRWAQAQGDYARLHTETGSYLLRITLNELEHQWAEQGFMRIHRSHAVNLNHVRRILHRQGRMSVQLHGAEAAELQVSRRSMPQVRERLEELTVRARSRGGGDDIGGADA